LGLFSGFVVSNGGFAILIGFSGSKLSPLGSFNSYSGSNAS
jgi:hypothetical protein